MSILSSTLIVPLEESRPESRPIGRNSRELLLPDFGHQGIHQIVFTIGILVGQLTFLRG